MILIILLSKAAEPRGMQTVTSTRRRDGFHEIFCTKMDFLSEVGRQTKGRSCLNLTSLYLVWFNHFFRQKVIVPAPEGRTRFIFPLRRLCCASICVGYMKTNDTGGEGDLDVLTSALRCQRDVGHQPSPRCWHFYVSTKHSCIQPVSNQPYRHF